MTQKHEVEVTVDVTVTIQDGTTALTRATENIEDFHDFFYPPITTEQGVIDYLASACVSYGVKDASRLDGWGDLERGQVTMDVTYARPAW